MVTDQKYASKTSIAIMLTGLIPFVCAIYYLQKYNFEYGIAIFIHYSAIILSFIGAINWGQNCTEKSSKLFYFSVIPSVIAFIAIFNDFPNNIIILSLGYFVAWFIDVIFLIKKKDFYVYLFMRTVITALVIYLHIYIL
jgi:hypothetical protein